MSKTRATRTSAPPRSREITGCASTPENMLDPKQVPIPWTPERATWDRAHRLGRLPIEVLAEFSPVAHRAKRQRRALDWRELCELAVELELALPKLERRARELAIPYTLTELSRTGAA